MKALRDEIAKLVNLYGLDNILEALMEALNTKADWTPDGPDRDRILRVVLLLDDLTASKEGAYVARKGTRRAHTTPL